MGQQADPYCRLCAVVVCVLVSRVAASLLLYSGLSLLHRVSSSSPMTSIRLYIVSSRCFSKIIIFFFSFSSTFSKYGVLG